MFNRRMLIAAVAAAAVLSGAPVSAQDKSIVVSSTTSTQDSGLFGHILPLFKQKTGIEVKVVRRAPARRSTPAGAAMPTWFSCTQNRGRKIPRRRPGREALSR